ncbi:TonB-dependent receptor plug domain-containing protein [Chitinophaga solisilvae]|uniref:TonB-dependent receptor plug domain-containing protein n=1 Tax=Chitinophaga solisilvae TaxID=1233460 RepID=UPI001367BD7C|nr:TonB-dependent receptor [Chitinophaga solisilvae]
MKFNIYTFSLLLFARAATAQDSISQRSQLSEVTVTAAKVPMKAGETGKIVTVLSREYLDKQGGKSISQVLNEQAGMVVNGASNNRGSIQEVYMRGAPNGNVLILVDGMPVSDASQIANTFDLNFISPDQIERIEILRGSQSTLYGSNAVTGVINIITRKTGDKKLGASLNAGYGSYNSAAGNVNVYGNVRSFSWQAGYKQEYSDGQSDAYDKTGSGGFDKDGFRQQTAFAKLGLQATSRWNLQYLFNWSNYFHDLDVMPYTDEKDYTGKYKYLLNSFSSEYKFKTGSWHVLYSYQHTNRKQINDSSWISPVGFGKYDDTRLISGIHQAETYVNWHISRVVQLVGGGAFSYTRMQQDNLNVGNYDGAEAVLSYLSPDSSHTSQTSVYASVLLHNLGGFNLEAGGRLNHHSLYGNNQTFSFNPSYLINNRHKIFINISSAYRVPSLYQLYTAGYGNRNLKPESTVSYETGYQATLAGNALNIRVAGFARKTRDLIVFISDTLPPYGGYDNAYRQRAYGGEAEAAWHITKGLDLTVNYSYTDGKITKLQDGKDTSYYNLLRIPKHAVNATLGYQVTRALYTSATLKYTGERYDNSQPMGDYYTIDLYGEYKFGNLLKIFAGFRNITDYQYFDILGYNSRRFNFNTGIVVNL